MFYMFYVYILEATNYKERYYIGYSEDLKKRLEEHNNGKNFFHQTLFAVENYLL